MERVLVTGAGGFTGSALLRLWPEIGPPAIRVGVDRAPHPGLPGDESRVCDLCDPASIATVVREVRPTLVFHLAGTFSNDFDADLAGNVLSTRNLLEALRTQADPGCRTLIVGSSAEYGAVAPAVGAIPESTSLQPVSTYGLTKVFQTHLASFYARVHRLNVVSVRPFNLLGPGMSPRLFTGSLYRQLVAFRRGEVAEIVLGRISGERDYVDVRDALRGYLVAVQQGTPGEVYNVGSGRLTPVAMLVQDIADHCRVDPRCLKVDDGRDQPSDAARAVPADIAKLRHLGWAPEMTHAASVRAFCAPIDAMGPAE